MDNSSLDQSINNSNISNTYDSNTTLDPNHTLDPSNNSDPSTSNTSTSSTNRRKFNPGRWLKEEDDRLRKLVNIYGDNNWSEISKSFQDRSDVQCQQRWDKVVNPELVKGPWTKDVSSHLYIFMYSTSICVVCVYMCRDKVFFQWVRHFKGKKRCFKHLVRREKKGRQKCH